MHKLLISYEHLEGYSKLQNPVILEYCSRVMGRELWKDVLYFLVVYYIIY